MKEINIALVAHDGRKQELLDWVRFNWKMLAKYNIWATGTTGRLITELVIEEDGKLIRPSRRRSPGFSPGRWAVTSRSVQ